jgi:hypothetical protein
MVYLKHKEMLIFSSLDEKKKSKVIIDGKIKIIYIPKELGNIIMDNKFYKFVEEKMDNNTSIVYV